MNHTIFIRVIKKDYPYLEWCLKSIAVFARGFDQVVLLCPSNEVDDLHREMKEKNICLDGTAVLPFDEWPGKGMLHGMFWVLNADYACPLADYIYHIDCDCVFEKPVTPETFWLNGKPMLRYEHWDSIIRRHGGIAKWRDAVEQMLPFPVPWECMRGHPEVYHRGLYSVTRQLIEQKMKRPLVNIFQDAQNSFPQSVVEFPCLGATALVAFEELYTPFNMAAQANPDLCDWPLQQFWSHGDINLPQDIWVKGRQKRVVPMDFIRNLGLCSNIETNLGSGSPSKT